MDIDVIRLENVMNYGIIDTITHNDRNYLILLNTENDQDFCVRRVILKDNKEVVVKLDNQNEFEEIMNLFYNKHRGEIENEK